LKSEKKFTNFAKISSLISTCQHCLETLRNESFYHGSDLKTEFHLNVWLMEFSLHI